MRRLGLLALLLLNATAMAQPCQALREYDEIVAVVTERFFDRTFNGVDWPTRVSKYRSQLACDTDPEPLAVVVNSLLAELRASHTTLYTQSDLHYWGLNSLFHLDDLVAYRINFAGVWPERRGASWYAKYILEDSAAQRAGVSPGDELIEISGNAFTPLGFPDSAAVLVVSSDGRTRRSLSIHAPTQSIMAAFVNASLESTRILRVPDKRVSFFHLWTARDRILEALSSAVRMFESQKVDALLLDLRGGYGGTSEDYLYALRDSMYLRGIPKYFLIDDSVRSGKELLAGVIKRDRLGTLIGSRTAGQYLGGMRHQMFDGKYFLLLAVASGDVPGVGKIEGIGIEPDVFVEPCREYCAGRDPILEKALDLIDDA